MTKLVDTEFSVQREIDQRNQQSIQNKFEETERTFREVNKLVELDNEEVMKVVLRFQRVFGKERNYPG